MPFVKGTTKTGGRTKGALNKKTIEQKKRAESVLNIIETNHLEKDIKKLTAYQRTSLYVGLMEYVAPKLRRVDGNLTGDITLKGAKVTFK